METYFKRKLKSEKRKWAEDESVKMFGKNLKSLLLTKPIRIKDKSRLVSRNRIFFQRYTVEHLDIKLAMYELSFAFLFVYATVRHVPPSVVINPAQNHIHFHQFITF